MTLYELIYEFFSSYIFPPLGWGDDMSFTLMGAPFTMSEYLCYIGSLISVVLILVLCCLFVYKIIKLVGNLIR